MTVSEIKQAAAAEERIRYLQQQKTRLRQRMTAMSQGNDGMPHSRRYEDSLAHYMARLDEVEREYDRLIMAAEELRCKVESEISSKLTPRQQKIVRLRLLQNKPWMTIAGMTHLEESSCRKTFKQAITKLEGGEGYDGFMSSYD